MYGAIIVAAGAGKRFRSKIPKQFLSLNGIPVFLWSVKAFKQVPKVKQILVVTSKPYIKILSRYATKYGFLVIEGGKRRQDSVLSGLNALMPGIDHVAIHDAARPLIEAQTIKKSFRTAERSGAAVVAVAARDTVKFTSSGTFVTKTLPRDNVFLAQTPQVFKVSLIKNAYKKLKNREVTDDAQAAELAGIKVSIVKGSYNNLKITEKNDFKTAKTILRKG